jgi:hypothetical protein
LGLDSICVCGLVYDRRWGVGILEGLDLVLWYGVWSPSIDGYVVPMVYYPIIVGWDLVAFDFGARDVDLEDRLLVCV